MSVKTLRALTCDKLREVDILKYEDKCLNSSFYFQTAIKSYWIFKYEINVDKIIRSVAYTDKMKNLIRIVKSCRNLEQVTLVTRQRDCTFAELRTLIKVICDRPFIKRLYLESLILYKEELLDLGRCSMLEVLSIKIVVQDKNLEDLFEKCPKLHSLNLIDRLLRPRCAVFFPPLSGTWLMKLPNNMLVLKVLTANYIKADYVRRTLERSRNLEVLYIDKLIDGAQLINDLAELVPLLKDLTIGPTVRDTNLGRFIHLKRLCFLNVSKPGNLRWIVNIAERCSALEDLTLLQVPPSMAAISTIVMLRNLTKLCLDGLFIHPLQFNASPVDFLSLCEKLQYLRIRSLNFTNEDALSVIENCPDLKYIEIEACLTTFNLIISTAIELDEQRLYSPNGRTTVLKMKLPDFKESDLNVQEIRESLQLCPLLELETQN